MKNTKLSILLSLLMVALVWSCDNDDPEPVNDEELITTVNVTFAPAIGGGAPVVASFVDTDGEGGNAATITNPTLSANTTYNVTIEFLDESDPSDVEDITEEVEEEDDEHQVFFVAAAGLNFQYAYGDQDGDGNPLGLTGTVTTGAASAGNLVLTLLHEPDKSAAGVSAGDPTNAGGESDVEITFNVTIQ